jgi:hypothetical protein
VVIDLEPGARPANIRQRRLTPKETKALLSKTGHFIKQGWLEPSTSPWNVLVFFCSEASWLTSILCGLQGSMCQ